MGEAEILRVEIEEAVAGSDDGDHEGVAEVKIDGVTHESEIQDGLEYAIADEVFALAHGGRDCNRFGD
jgi:hypothetical protein